MITPRPVTVAILRLSESISKECRVVAKPDKSPAEMAMLRQLQAKNSMRQAAEADELRTEGRVHVNIRPQRHE